MENATKALLITASVLIVIILVALGVKLLSSANSTQEAATQTQNSISDKTGDVAGTIILGLTDVSAMSNLEFNIFLVDNYFGVQSGKKVLEMCNLILKKYGTLRDDNYKEQAHITGYLEGSYTYDNIMISIDKNKKYYVWRAYYENNPKHTNLDFSIAVRLNED